VNVEDDASINKERQQRGQRYTKRTVEISKSSQPSRCASFPLVSEVESVDGGRAYAEETLTSRKFELLMIAQPSLRSGRVLIGGYSGWMPLVRSVGVSGRKTCLIRLRRGSDDDVGDG